MLFDRGCEGGAIREIQDSIVFPILNLNKLAELLAVIVLFSDRYKEAVRFFARRSGHSIFHCRRPVGQKLSYGVEKLRVEGTP